MNLKKSTLSFEKVRRIITNSGFFKLKATSGGGKGLMAIVLIISCFGLSNCNKDPKSELFSESYDELTSYYINIEALAKGMDVSVGDLVKIRYGLIECNPDLAEELTELLNEYQKYNSKKVKKILEDKHKFAISSATNSLSSSDLLQNYRKSVFARNERFQAKMPGIAGDEIVNNVEKYIDKEFAWYRFPINGWNLLIEGKENTYKKYSSQISALLSESQINSIVVKRFNGYEDLIEAEVATLFNKNLDIAPLKGISHDTKVALTSKEILNKFVKRSSVDLTDLLITLIQEVGIALIIWLGFSYIINRVENYYAEQEIGYVKGAGWWNVAFFAFDMWNIWERDEEVRKWKRIKGWTQGIIFAIFLGVTWIYVIKPSGQLESEIISACETNVSEYIKNVDLPLQEYFNNIIESEL